MILISSNNYDVSTSSVAEWLIYYKKAFVIFTETNTLEAFDYVQVPNSSWRSQLTTNSGQTISNDEVESVWYRRGRYRYKEKLEVSKEDKFRFLISHNQNELEVINDFLMRNLSGKINFGKYSKGNLNKLEVLRIASEVGLSIPKTIITTTKNQVLKEFKSARIISKTISEIIHLNIQERVYSNRTIEVSVDSLPDCFFPSLFQELINKKYELRVFFLGSKFYSMAIFSQADEKTVLDFRNYNYGRPNRTAPFNLPKSVEIRLNELAKKLNLDSGSIDVLVTLEDQFVFLEVNPIGQFGMVSHPCNYYLEREIANVLKSANGKA
jgi:ATP-GRASP peptide maturase of grasp-with-spasm system